MEGRVAVKKAYDNDPIKSIVLKVTITFLALILRLININFKSKDVQYAQYALPLN